MGDPTRPTVTIVGAGFGGFSLAGMMRPEVCRVRIHDIDDGRLAALREAKAIEVEGADGGIVPLDVVTSDVRAAADGADIIIVCSGGVAQAGVARSLAPVLRDGQVVLLVQGNTGGALVVRRALDQSGCAAAIDLAEMDNFPISWRRTAPARIRPITAKKRVQIAAFPGRRGDAVFPRLAPLFPTAVAAPDIIHTGFMNGNAMLHVANCIGNAGLIDRAVPYKFYAEGVTPAIARLYEAIDAERVQIAACLGATVPSIAVWLEQTYGVGAAPLPEMMQRLTFDSGAPYAGTPTPASFQHKYIAEDVPAGLVPMREIGRAVGVATPAMDAVVGVASIMAGANFAADARTLDRLGLVGMDAGGIQRIASDGFAQAPGPPPHARAALRRSPIG